MYYYSVFCFMTRYYDLVLGLIPLAFGLIAAPLAVVGFERTTAVLLASVVAVALIGHAMFVNGPVDDTPSEHADAGFQPAD